MKDIKVPVLFLVFNRPEVTRRVFEKIREVKPSRLYIAADGPRNHLESDFTKCKEVRDITESVDWNCKVSRLYREENIGCKTAVSSGIKWFFEHEEQGIILEDDCLPHDSFFPFCQELLFRYKDDNRVMHISGTNYQNGWIRDMDYSYYYSAYSHIWGWATWRRAWDLYDVALQTLPEVERKGYLRGYLSNKIEMKVKLSKLNKVYRNKLDTWDYQWEYCLFTQNGLGIIPNVNLVENIGFGAEATHTFNSNDDSAKRKSASIDFPLNHPPFVIRDRISDKKFYWRLIWNKIKAKILSLK